MALSMAVEERTQFAAALAFGACGPAARTARPPPVQLQVRANRQSRSTVAGDTNRRFRRVRATEEAHLDDPPGRVHGCQLTERRVEQIRSTRAHGRRHVLGRGRRLPLPAYARVVSTSTRRISEAIAKNWSGSAT